MALGHWLKDYIGPRGSASSGGGTEPLIVRPNGDTLDKTWQEIYDAFPNVVIDSGDAGAGVYQRNVIDRVDGFGNEYRVAVGSDTYKATSASGYPEADIG